MKPIDLEAITAELDKDDLAEFNDDILSKTEFEKWLNRQRLSADAKSLINSIAQTTVYVGGKIVRVGMKILSTCLNMIKTFPHTAFGVVIGAVLSVLVGSVPLIGALIGPFLAPLFLAFGVGMGAIADFQSSAFRARMDAVEAEYASLRT